MHRRRMDLASACRTGSTTGEGVHTKLGTFLEERYDDPRSDRAIILYIDIETFGGGVGRTPMAPTRFSPRPRLAFCTGLYPLSPFGAGESSVVGAEMGVGGKVRPDHLVIWIHFIQRTRGIWPRDGPPTDSASTVAMPGSMRRTDD
jgi:hypothetical protein